MPAGKRLNQFVFSLCTLPLLTLICLSFTVAFAQLGLFDIGQPHHIVRYPDAASVGYYLSDEGIRIRYRYFGPTIDREYGFDSQLIVVSTAFMCIAWLLLYRRADPSRIVTPIRTLCALAIWLAVALRSQQLSTVSRAIVLIAIVLPFLPWLTRKIITTRSQRRIANGLCASCGYDLRASPTQCPECGLPTPTAPTFAK